MKPHEEETWCVDETEDGEHLVKVSGSMERVFGRGRSKADAKLAAQAPAMAQLLLKMQNTFRAETGLGLTEVQQILRDAGVIP